MTQQPPPPSRHPGADSLERNFQRLRLRQDTEENWLKNDPVPASGELCYTIGGGSPGRVLKVGDGTVPWSNLPYLAREGVSGVPGPPGADGHGITVYGPQDRPPAPANLASGDIWLCSTPGYPGHRAFDANIVTPGAKGDKGDKGDAASIAVGRVVSVGPNAAPTVQNSGTSSAAVFDFSLQQGAKGDKGDQGIQGLTGSRGPAGETFKVSGAVANAAALPSNPPHLSVYVTQNDAHLHIYDTSSSAADSQGYVDLGAIEGKQGESFHLSAPVPDAASLPAVGQAGQCVQTTNDGHLHCWDATGGRWIDGGQWRGPSGKGVQDGTADGQIPTWDTLTNSWLAKAPVKGVPDGAAQDDMLRWDASTNSWLAKAMHDGKFRGALTYPPQDGSIEEVYYLIADTPTTTQRRLYPRYVPGSNQYSFVAVPYDDRMFPLLALGQAPSGDAIGSARTQWNGSPEQLQPFNEIFEWHGVNWRLADDPNAPQALIAAIAGGISDFAGLVNAGVMIPKPYGVQFDARMLPVLQAGAEPDPTDPSKPLMVGGVAKSLDSSWQFIDGQSVFHVVNTSRLIARIAAGETQPMMQWYAGANRPIEEVTASAVGVATTGWYRHDGSAWVKILTVTTLDGLTDVAAALQSDGTPLEAGDILFYDAPNLQWKAISIDAFTKANVELANIGDCTISGGATPTDGQVLTWDGTSLVWTNKTPDLRKTLASLDDTGVSSPVSGEILSFDGTNWANALPPGYTKTEVDTKLSSLITGLEHEESVLSITATPPAAPAEGDLYIVATGATGAWAGHVNELALWDNGAWKFATARANETHLVEDQSALFHWNGTAWVKVASAVAGSSARAGVGEIVAWPLDTYPASDYLECDGRIVAVSQYADLHAVIGNKYNPGTAADGTSTFALPDLRGYFLRGTGANGGEARTGVKQNDTTRLPRTAFTGTTNTTGAHTHTYQRALTAYDAGVNAYAADNNDGGQTPTSTSSNGDHSHTVTIAGGGDPQTRPISSSVKWLIRYKPINGGAKGDKGDKGDNGVGVPATATDGQIIVRRSGAWTAEAMPSGLPAGTNGQILQHNGTNWTAANHVRSYRTWTDLNSFHGMTNGLIYKFEGVYWPASNQFPRIGFRNSHDVTLSPDEGTWNIWCRELQMGGAWANPTAGHGYSIESNWIQPGAHWMAGSMYHWFEVIVNLAAANKDNRPPIRINWTGSWNTGPQCQGTILMFPPAGVEIDKIVFSGSSTHYWHMSCAEMGSVH